MSAWSVKQSGVIHQDFEGEVVVIDLASGNYFSLAGSGGALWRQLARGSFTAESLAAALVALHDIDQARAAADVASFLADLEREGLVVRCDGATDPVVPAGTEGPDQGRTPYAPPKVVAYHDLQELFLLDPVHDVDPSAGWPHAAAAAPDAAAMRDAAAVPAAAAVRDAAAVRMSAADIAWASAGGTTIVVHRDRGLYCRLDGTASRVWQELASGHVQVTDPSIADALVSAGLAEHAAAPESCEGVVTGEGIVSVHHELVDQIRPWGQRRRPARIAATDATKGMCDRLDAWFASCVPDPCASDHSVAGHAIRVELPRDGDYSRLAWALPPSEATIDAGSGLLIRAWRGTAAQPSPVLANLFDSLRARWDTLCGPRGEVIDLHTDTTSAIFDPGTGILSVIDRERRRAWCVKGDDAPLPFWEIGSPFRFLLHDHFAHHGLQFVHGAAVGDGGRALLIVGAGGSGKSSTAMACAGAGLRYLGDDYCLVDCESCTVHSLYRSGKLVGPHDLERLPTFLGHSMNDDSFERGGPGKGVFLVDSVVPGSLAASMPIAGISIPRIGSDGKSRVERASGGDALAALVPSTLGQLPGAGSSDARRLERLVLQCRITTLVVGRDPAGIAAAVREAIAACSP